MWPWGHVAVAYLAYSGYTRWHHGRPPIGPAAVAVVLGSQAPDLVDKTFGWHLDVLPGGRTFAHSLLGSAAILTAVALLARRVEREDLGIAYTVGHLAHLLMDLPPGLPLGDIEDAIYLLWPVLEPPEYREVDGILEGLLRADLGPYEAVQLGLFAVAIVVWIAEGAPGVGTVRGLGRRGIDRLRGGG